MCEAKQRDVDENKLTTRKNKDKKRTYKIRNKKKS